MYVGGAASAAKRQEGGKVKTAREVNETRQPASIVEVQPDQSGLLVVWTGYIVLLLDAARKIQRRQPIPARTPAASATSEPALVDE